MFCYLLVLMSLHHALGVYPSFPYRWDDPFVLVYSRDVENPVFDNEIKSIQAKIEEIFNKATSAEGISFELLKKETIDLKEQAQSVLSRLNDTVSDEDIKNLLVEAAAESYMFVILGPKINGLVTYEAKRLNVSFASLQLFQARLGNLKDSGDSYSPTLAAIVWICDDISDILKVTENFIQKKISQRSLLRRSWSTNLNAGYDKNNGLGASGGLTYTNGNFRAGATAGWNEGHGTNLGAGFSYSWRRR
ncbi:hypothetical protein Btru_041043 [Bulinus truncatus]|nr:hypothetical protein Btru_041043 [Bulinus truncatus]